MTDLVKLGFRADSSGIVKAERDMKSLTNASGRLDKQNKLTERSLGLVGAAIAALGVSAGIRDVIRYADAWSSVTSQLRQVTESEKELLSVRKQVFAAAQDTRSDLQATVGLYAALDRSTTSLGLNTARQIGLTKTINNLFVAGGKSAEEASGAIRQLVQGLEAGALRGDEFNSVAEGAPRILDALAESLSIGRGELREFAATGGITAEILVDALEGYSDTAQKMADQTAKTFGQSMQAATNNMAQFAGESEAVTYLVGGLGDSIENLSSSLVENSPYVEAYFSRFAVWGENIQETARIIDESFTNIVNSSAEAFPILAENSNTVLDQIIDGFKNLPDNLRAAVQILTVELAHLVDLGMAYGQSFAEVLGVQIGALIDKSEIWGKQLLNNLNPFEDTVSFEQDIARIEQISGELTDAIIDKAVKRAEVVRQARLDSIGTILDEREAAIATYGVIVKGLDDVADSSKSATESQELLFAAFKETSEAPKWIQNLSKEAKSIADLRGEIDNLGGSWSRTGSVIVDTFGSMADALDNYGAKMRDINKLQDKLNTERKKDGADLVKLDELQMKLNNERASAEIGNYAAITGAAQDMFSEKTAAYKAFSAINQALSIAEIALAYQKISASNQETANAIANEGAKQSSNALTAITGAFAAPFPANFAAGAAMIAIMSSLLGGSFGGGGGGYEKPELGGTGTVLGDSSAQSSSISNALNDFEDVQVDQLAELRGIRSALTGLSGGIERLAAQFSTDLNFGDSGLNLQNSNFLDTSLGGLLRKFDPVGVFADIFDKITGDFLGLGGIVDKIFGGFSSKKQKLVDSGITFMSQTLGSIFDGDTLNASLFQTIETTKKKFWGLSKSTSTSTNTSPIGNAINEQMADIFGFIGDSVVSAAESLGMDAKHIITTGLETLSLEEALEGFVIDLGDISFKDKTGEEIQKELEAIFSQQADLVAEYLVPSITEYQKVGEGAFETLQRVAYEQAVFNDAMDNIGIAFADLSNIMKIDVAQSVIGLIGSVEDFASLTSSLFENFYSESEQLSALEKSLRDVFESLGLSMVDSREAFRDLVEGIDVTTEAGQEMLAALLEINPAMAEYLDALDDLANEKLNLQIQLLEKQGKSEEALALSRELELASMDESLHAIMLQIWALDDAARAEHERAEAIAEAEALANQQKNLQVRLLEAQGKSEAALALQRELELASLDESLHALQKQIWAQEDLNKAQEALNAAREEERRLLQDNIAFAERELEKARRAEIDKINATLAAAKDSYDAQIELINSQRDAYYELIDQLEQNVTDAANEVEKARALELDRINATISKAQEAYDLELESIQAQRNAYNTMISEIENRLSGAESALNKSLDAELSKYDDMIAASNDSAQEQISAINSVSSARISALNSELSIVSNVAAQFGASSKGFTASQALAAARSGNFEPANNITTGGDFNSALEARIAGAREAFALNEIGKLADASLTDLEKTIQATESSAQSQIDAINEANEKQIAQLEEQKQALQDQVNAVLGVNEAILSIDDAIAQYEETQKELQNAISQQTLAKLDAQEGIAKEAFEKAKEDAQKHIDALNAQVDAVLGIDNSVMDLTDAISSYQNAQLELTQAQTDGTLEALQEQEDLAKQAYENAEKAAKEQIDALNKQVDELLNINNSVMGIEEAIKMLQAERKELADFEASIVNDQVDVQKEIATNTQNIYNAIIDERQDKYDGNKLVTIINDPNLPIVTPPIVIRPDPQSDAKLIAEIKSMKNEINNANRSMAKSQATTAKILQRIELDGLEVRQ